MVHHPTVLGSCEHFYCRKCIQDYLIGENCPKCCVPSHAKEVMPNRSLSVCVTLVKQLQALFTDSSDYVDTRSLDTATHVTSSSKVFKHKPNRNSEEESSEVVKKAKKSMVKTLPSDSTEADLTKQSSVTKQTATKKKRVQPRVTGKDADQTEQVLPVLSAESPAIKSASIDAADVVEENIGRRTKQGKRSKRTSKQKDLHTSEKSSSAEDKKVSVSKSSTLFKSPSLQSNSGGTSRSDLVDSPQSTPQSARERSKPVRSRRNSKDLPIDLGSGATASATTTPKSTPARQKQKSRVSGSIEKQPWLSPASFTTPVSRRSSRGLSPGFSPSSSRGLCSPLVSKKNHKGETALHQACIKGDVELVESLLDQGAQVNVKDNAGWTPLHEVCNHGHVRIIELLLTHGASINIPGMENVTPLHDAVENNRVECVKFLISRGANVNARNVNGKTPFDFALTKPMKAAFKTPVLEEFADKNLSQGLLLSLQIHQVVILATGLTRDQKILLQKCASIMHGKVVQEFSNEVTHVVTSVNSEGQCPRTMKFLKAVIAGKWILTFDWVSTCLEYNSRVSEEPFEVGGSSMSPNSQAPTKSRLNMDQQLPGLFDGCNMFFCGDFNYPTPEKQQLIELVKLGGANVIIREPKLELIERNESTVPYHAKTGTVFSQCGYFVVYDTNADVKFEVFDGLLCKVTAAWVMDCIANFHFIVPT